MTNANASIDAATRKEIFHEQYGNEIDAATTLADIVTAAGVYLAEIIGAEDADAGMARMVRPVVDCAGASMEEDSQWKAALSAARSYCFSEWPLGQSLHDLAAYAVYGIILAEFDDPSKAADYLSLALGAAERFLAKSPLAQWKTNTGAPEKSDLARLVRLASNRWALDNGKPIEPLALAEFGGVSEGRIRNLMSEQALTVEDGKIAAYDALEWLKERPDFWNSVWREQRAFAPEEVEMRAPLDSVFFVPVARDGSVFNPGLHRGGGFTVGEKGVEKQLATFEEALAELQRMPVPRWRRPNKQGHWGIVRSVRWERLSATALRAFADFPAHRLPKSIE